MPSIGSCDDTTCDDEIKDLYECHCCLRLVCLNHLNGHVEITKQNKQQFDGLRNKLNTVVNTLKLIIEEKQLSIEREQKLIEHTKTILDIPSSSTDELRNIYEQINQTIASNRPDVAEESGISNDNEYSTDINHDFVDVTSFNETVESIQSHHVNNVDEVGKRMSYRNVIGRCPLTFDGAYGLTQANHSVEFCSHGKTRRMDLYLHFMWKHRIKKIYAQRLIQAITDNRDPRTTKLFDGNGNIIDHFSKVPCPFFSGQSKSLRNVTIPPCKHRLVSLTKLQYHLRVTHKISKSSARKIVDDFKEKRTKNDIASAALIPSK